MPERPDPEPGPVPERPDPEPGPMPERPAPGPDRTRPDSADRAGSGSADRGRSDAVGHDDLIGELRALGRWIDVPEPVDQRAALRARLAGRAPRRRRVRLLLAAALAALTAAVAAVEPARATVADALGDLLGVAGIEVRRERPSGPLPATPAPLPSLRAATLAEARRVALFAVRVPAGLGEPAQVLLAAPDPGGAPQLVTLVYGGGSVRLDQFDGRVDGGFFKTAPDARWVDLGGDGMAIWLPGPHPVTFVGRDGVQRTETARLASPTLIWTAGGLTFRLEGVTDFGEATKIASSLR